MQFSCLLAQERQRKSGSCGENNPIRNMTGEIILTPPFLRGRRMVNLAVAEIVTRRSKEIVSIFYTHQCGTGEVWIVHQDDAAAQHII